MRRGHVNSQVIRAQLIVETLLPKEIGRENQISLRHGGQLTVADLSDSDGRFMMVQFDPENTSGIAFSAYFEDNERFFSAPGCHIRMGEADSEGSFEFNSSTPSNVDPDYRTIVTGLATIQNVLAEAAQG